RSLVDHPRCRWQRRRPEQDILYRRGPKGIARPVRQFERDTGSAAADHGGVELTLALAHAWIARNRGAEGLAALFSHAPPTPPPRGCARGTGPDQTRVGVRSVG